MNKGRRKGKGRKGKEKEGGGWERVIGYQLGQVYWVKI